jgi:formate--tetrahydrofolate ligase
MDELEAEDVEAVERGLANLDRHVRNLEKFGVPVVVALNRFPGDSDAEVETVVSHCEEELGVRVAESNVFSDGGEGGLDLAEKLVEAAEEDSSFAPLYEVDRPITEKIETVATEIYGADGVEYTDDAEEDIAELEELGLDDTPVCMSKTFHSLSDDPSLKGVPEDWTLTVREVYPSAGAGFVVALTGDVLTLPGLAKTPAAAGMDVDDEGNVSGLF